MKQFYFYGHYARPICKLTHKEAGQLIKAICGYMFNGKEPNEKTPPKARALFYLLQEQLSNEKDKGSATAKRNTEHFTFLLSYAEFIETLSDEETGLLIKQCCNFMFGTPPLTADEEKEIDGYFGIIKTSLSKSKRQSENIDCAPEALEYSSPGMPEYDIWLPSWLLERARDKERKMKKLTYSQFIDRLSMCVCGRSPSGSAYEKTLQTNVELLRDKYALVFVNFHLLCDRSGGKKGVYTAVGDMVGTVRQIWDSTHTPMMFLASEDFVKVMDKDDEGRKLNRRVGGATRV